MSVVVIRDGVIAADTFGALGGMKLKSRKLIRQGDVVIGHVGNWIDGNKFAEWHFAGADMENLPTFHNRGDEKVDFSAVVLTPNGWEYWDEMFYRDNDLQCNPYIAIGGGAETAMGAFHMGANAIEAVEAACALATHCGLPIEHYSIEQTVPDLDIKELGRILHELEGGHAQPLGLVE